MLKKSSALFLALTLCFASCLAQSGFAVEAQYDDDDYEFDYNDDDVDFFNTNNNQYNRSQVLQGNLSHLYDKV